MPAAIRFAPLLVLGLLPAGCGQPAHPPRPPARLTTGVDVGQLAPEIEGADVDGRTFKLSDYRGKVVVLDFWGDW